jgi:hypothetical protein
VQGHAAAVVACLFNADDPVDIEVLLSILHPQVIINLDTRVVTIGNMISAPITQVDAVSISFDATSRREQMQQRACAQADLLDDLVGHLLKMQRHLKPERVGRFDVDDQLELARRLHRKVGRLLALEDGSA